MSTPGGCAAREHPLPVVGGAVVRGRPGVYARGLLSQTSNHADAHSVSVSRKRGAGGQARFEACQGLELPKHPAPTMRAYSGRTGGRLVDRRTARARRDGGSGGGGLPSAPRAAKKLIQSPQKACAQTLHTSPSPCRHDDEIPCVHAVNVTSASIILLSLP